MAKFALVKSDKIINIIVADVPFISSDFLDYDLAVEISDDTQASIGAKLIRFPDIFINESEVIYGYKGAVDSLPQDGFLDTIAPIVLPNGMTLIFLGPITKVGCRYFYSVWLRNVLYTLFNNDEGDDVFVMTEGGGVIHEGIAGDRESLLAGYTALCTIKFQPLSGATDI